MSYATKEQQNAYSKAHYQANKKSYFARNRRYKKTLRDFLTAFKSGKPCKDCEVVYPHYVMDFDHKDGRKKTDNVSRLVHFSKKRLDAELRLCDLVCSNCHRERTAARLRRASKSKTSDL